MSRNLGKMGETTFTFLCNTVNITCTKPEEDKYGWDFLLEFPNENKKDLSLDKQDSPIECKVQIKSTDKNDFKLPIKLSAIHRLVKTNMPTFICFLHFNNTNEVKNMYLVHINENIISNVLKRIRENELSKKKLHKLSITIDYSDYNKLNNISGESLKNKIEEYVKDGMNQYVVNKNKYLQTLGFDTNSLSFSVKFKTNEIKDIIDMSLGLKKSVEVNIGQLFEERFKVKLPLDNHPLSNLENVHLSIDSKPTKDIELTIKENLYSIPLAKYNMQIFSSPFNCFLKNNLYKYVIKNDSLTFILSSFENDEKIICDFNFKKFYLLWELVETLKLPYIASIYSNKSLLFEFKDIFNNKTQLKGKIGFSEDFIVLIEAYYKSSYLLDSFNKLKIDSNFFLTLEEIELNSQNILCLYNLLMNEPQNIKIEFNTNQKFLQKTLNTFHCLLPIKTLLNNKIIGVVFKLTSNYFDITDNLVSFYPMKKEIYNIFEFDYHDYEEEQFIKYLDRLAVECDEDENTLCFTLYELNPNNLTEK